MDFLWIFGVSIIIIGVLSLISLILPWINYTEIKKLKQQIQQLQKQNLTQNLIQPQSDILPTQITSPEKNISFTSHSDKKIKNKINFEQQFGSRLPVWIGGIALALAGFFLVKYSIEAGLLTEKVRVILGSLFGLVLIFVGNWIHSKPQIANGTRIAQALTGAGIADLYGCAFAASNLYHLIPSYVGFIIMAGITFTAILLSLRQGSGIAFLGLFGGFLTPLILQSSNYNIIILLTYLYIIITSIFILIRQKNWGYLFFPLMIGVLGWSIYWIFFRSLFYLDCFWIALFLIAINISFIAIFIQEGEKKFSYFKKLSLFISCASIFFITRIGFINHLDVPTWSLFGLIAIGSIALAYFKPKIYGYLPWILMFVNGMMLITWHQEANILITTLIIFAAIYCLSSLIILRRSTNPLSWSGLLSTCHVLYYLIAYFKLHNLLSISQNIWGMIAIIFSVLYIMMIIKVLEKFEKFNNNTDLKQKILTVFVLTSVTFLTIGLLIIIKQKLIPITLCAEIFVISWINSKVDIKSLKTISGLLLAVLLLKLFPEISVFTHLIENSLTIQLFNSVTDFSLIPSPLFQLGIPAVLLAGSSIFFSQKKYNYLTKTLEIISLVFFIMMTYCYIRYSYHHFENFFLIRASIIERGIFNNILFLFGLLSIWFGKKFSRSGLLESGVALIGICLARIIYFDLILYNPLWTLEYIGKIIILNALLLSYGLPLIGILITRKILNQSTLSLSLNLQNFLKWISLFSLFLLFIYITLNIRQFYHQDGFLNSGLISNAEIYSYSVGWLLLAIGLLFIGTLNHSQSIRIASLIIMMLTVGKVFLYDASELTGLLRVFSFFGLGLCLIIISWFYSRFVFSSKQKIQS